MTTSFASSRLIETKEGSAIVDLFPAMAHRHRRAMVNLMRAVAAG